MPTGSHAGRERGAAVGGARGGLCGASGGGAAGAEQRSGKSPGTQSVVARSALRSHPPLSIHRPTGRLALDLGARMPRMPLIMILRSEQIDFAPVNSPPSSPEIIYARTRCLGA